MLLLGVLGVHRYGVHLLRGQGLQRPTLLLLLLLLSKNLLHQGVMLTRPIRGEMRLLLLLLLLLLRLLSCSNDAR